MLGGECQKEKFKFNHDHPDEFTKCFWHKHVNIFLSWMAYRLSLTLYFFCVLWSSICFRIDDGFIWYKNALYLSTFTCLFECVLFGLGFGISVKRFIEEKKNPALPPLTVMPRSYKALWIMYNLTASNTLVVTFMFWFFVYNPDTDKNLAFVITSKFLNSLFLIIDYLLCEFPFRLLHIYVPCLFPVVYIIFSVIYQLSGGTGNNGKPNLYRMLNWFEPQKPVIFLIMYTSLCVFSHCGMCTLHFLKLWIKRRREGEDQDQD